MNSDIKQQTKREISTKQNNTRQNVPAAFISTSWLMGYKPKEVLSFAAAANSASFFRIMFEGEVEMWLQR